MIYYAVQLSSDCVLSWLQRDEDDPDAWHRGSRVLTTATEIRRVMDGWPSEYIDLLVPDGPLVPLADELALAHRYYTWH